MASTTERGTPQRQFDLLLVGVDPLLLRADVLEPVMRTEEFFAPLNRCK
jgi:hypothetical protein